jgi:hypothetical protein
MKAALAAVLLLRRGSGAARYYTPRFAKDNASCLVAAVPAESRCTVECAFSIDGSAAFDQASDQRLHCWPEAVD